MEEEREISDAAASLIFFQRGTFMDQYGKAIRVGAAVIACALLLRLGSTGVFDPVVRMLTDQSAAAVFLFLETGHVIRPVEFTDQTETTGQTQPPETTLAPEQTTEATKPPQTIPVFAPGDAALVEVHSYCGYQADVPSWLEQPLHWDLTKSEPTVLILHSHGTESYENTEGYQESSSYRTRDENYNVISVGDALVRLLESGGVHVLHDRQLHDYPSYNDSYENSRAAAKAYLKEYPSIQLVLDIHRDSVTDNNGKQLRYTVDADGQAAAQLMLVVGTDAGGLSHAKWPENMSLAVKLHAQLEKLCPGICRPISFRSQRFNQDLSTGALLVEVGAAGNTRQEALKTAEYLAQAILDLSAGTQ